MSISSTLHKYIHPSRFIDSEQAQILSKAQTLTEHVPGSLGKAVALYYWVRDEIRYNPYALSSEPDAFLASTTLHAGEGWCVPKALLLAALCRAVNIPARVGFADVRNHLSTERMRQAMKTDIFYFHGYTSLFLQGKWVKATPAFNIQLCEKFGLRPLEFNGQHDSLYHEFDIAGNKHMEYLHDRGEFIDLPFDEMIAVFNRYYPDMLVSPEQGASDLPKSTDWDTDVEREGN